MILKNSLPIEHQETIPSKWYFKNEYLEIEKRDIFLKEWQLIGSRSKVKKPGDVVVADIAQNPIIVVCQKNGDLKAFYNVCQHRGGPLAYENCNTNALQCKYHGWVYELNGDLKNTRGFDDSALKKERYGMVEVSVCEWMGQVFVNLSQEPHDISLRLNKIKDLIKPLDVSDYRFVFRESYEIACNWKVYMDNFLEGFHIPFVHPKLNQVIDYKQYKTELFDYFSLQWCPLENELSPYGSVSKKEENKAYYFTIFPNIILNIAPGRLQTNIVEPITSRTCMVHFDYHFDNPKNSNVEKDAEFSELIQQEDIKICESVQRGLESEGYDVGRFSPENETGVYHFQSMIRSVFSDV